MDWLFILLLKYQGKITFFPIIVKDVCAEEQFDVD
jgi:hypothetical protein